MAFKTVTLETGSVCLEFAHEDSEKFLEFVKEKYSSVKIFSKLDGVEFYIDDNLFIKENDDDYYLISTNERGKLILKEIESELGSGRP